MIVVHGTWVAAFQKEGRFLFWAEGDQLHKPNGTAHPFAVNGDRLQSLLALPGEVGLAIAVLPQIENGPQPSPALAARLNLFGPAQRLGVWIVEVVAVEPLTALTWLATMSPSEGWQPGDDLRFWQQCAGFGLELLARHRLAPVITAESLESDQEEIAAAWRLLLTGNDRDRLVQLAQALPPSARALAPYTSPRSEKPKTKPKAKRSAQPQPKPKAKPKASAQPLPVVEAPPAGAVVHGFLEAAVDAAGREWGRTGYTLPRHDPHTLGERWLKALLSGAARFTASMPAVVKFRQQFQTWAGALARASGLGEADSTFRVSFRLEAPPTPNAPWRIDFLLQATDDLSLLVPAEQVWQEKGKTLRFLDRRFDQPQEKLLAALGTAARLFPPLGRALHQSQPTGLDVGTDEAYLFLQQAALLLEESGFGVLVPNWWGQRAKLRAKLVLKTAQKPPPTGKSFLALEKLATFQWQLALGDTPLTREEFEQLAALKQPLVQVRGQWVELDPAQLQEALALFQKGGLEGQLSAEEALRLGLTGQAEALRGIPVEGVEVQGWFEDLLRELRDPAAMPHLPKPQGLQATLRPYQERGMDWLAFLTRYGFGACLADDMGLGKTIQTISLILYDREARGGDGPVLLVCPTSVMGNWQREVRRFAPGLRVLLHHGAERASGTDFLQGSDAYDLIVTSYGLALRDSDLLKQRHWRAVVLDEAQNIKNPDAKQTQAIRTIPSDFRLALTGTPVENRLTELWSIMHFLNPGHLGNRTNFRQELALPIENHKDEHAAHRLRALVQPFILRRVKSDPKIIQDLPDKIEQKQFVPLTAEQATLYEAVVRETMEKIEDSEGIQRRGLVLSLLLRLKQLCNHPALFLDDGSALPDRSGKLIRLEEMVDELLSEGDAALIFTQFSSMGTLLQHHLQRLFGIETLFLHGGTPQPMREKMVERFQQPNGPQLFLLSLKAGGTGLNLTRANHVFHFDRWWNPAVENQATDRAYRIGQQRTVQVHKFISMGTMEEKIDALIESKQALADSIVGAGEEWLTELDTDALRELVTLRPG